MTLANEAIGLAPIRRAEAADAAALTDLALTSKAMWGYDAAFMAACRAELTVHPATIARDPTYLIEADGRISRTRRAPPAHAASRSTAIRTPRASTGRWACAAPARRPRAAYPAACCRI